MKKYAIVGLSCAYILASVALAQTNEPPTIPQATENLIDQVVALLNSLYGLPSHGVVLASCLVVGYVLRSTKRFPNDGIPLACVFWGAIFNPLIADVRQSGTPLRLWLVKNILMGLIIGAVAWAFHKRFLKRFEDKVPVLGDMLANADKESEDYQRSKAVETPKIIVENTGTHAP